MGLYNYIYSLPLGIETVMGEAGNNFSEGQKQRLNIARGILKRLKIYNQLLLWIVKIGKE